MCRRVILGLVLTAVAGIVAAAERAGVRIESPRPGATVEWQEVAFVQADDKFAEVWVIVHPTATCDYWVQPPAHYDRERGRWVAGCYFGRPGMDRGAHFEVAAVANPGMNLRDGLILRGWPPAAATSPVIHVTRR